MYVNYDWYKTEYGGLIPENQFPKLEKSAERYIRSATFIKGDIFANIQAEYEETLKETVCEIVELIYTNSDYDPATGIFKERQTISSENTDGYSVTYKSTSSDSSEALQKKIYSAMRRALLPTGWLSRSVGVYDDYKQHYHNLQSSIFRI